MVSIRQPEQPGHLASKAEQHLEPEQQQDSGLAEPLAVAEPSVAASADPPELAVAAKQAGRIAVAASAVQQRRELGVAARVAELGVAAIAVQQGQPGAWEQQPEAWVQREQQTTAAPSEQREQRGNQQQQAHQLVH